MLVFYLNTKTVNYESSAMCFNRFPVIGPLVGPTLFLAAAMGPTGGPQKYFYIFF